jgi:hypothetical protein
MPERFFHGRGYNGLRDIAENGAIKGFDVDDEDIFPEMRAEQNVHGKEKAVWVTDSVECAKAYAWGGGYLEIDPSNIKVTEDSNSCYSVVMREELPLHHVDRIMIEENNSNPADPKPDLGLEIANLMDEEFQDIRIGYYEPETYEINMD